MSEFPTAPSSPEEKPESKKELIVEVPKAVLPDKIRIRSEEETDKDS